MTRVPDLVVLGGGVVGLSCAIAAADRGLSVMVVDQLRPGAASRAAAGMLAPTVEGLPADVMPMAVAARDFYPRFLGALRDRTEVDVPLDRRGILELASSEKELAALAQRAPASSERLDASALAALEPAFASHVGAYLHPTDGAVDNVTLMSALDVAAAQHPRVARVGDEVSSFDRRDRLRAFVSRGGTRYPGGRFLVATGAWAGTLPGLPRTLPVRPVRGQLMRLAGPPIRHVTYGAGGYLVPRGPSLLIGATSEDAGFEHATTARGLSLLQAIATRAIPVLKHADVLDHWSGFRPMTPDGLPILDRDPQHETLFYACGFSRNGILLAPWAADLVADLIRDGRRADAMAPFALSRFETSANPPARL